MSCPIGRRYRQSKRPVRTSSAITWLPGVATNITPPFTIGAPSWPLETPVEKTHSGCNRAMLFGVI